MGRTLWGQRERHAQKRACKAMAGCKAARLVREVLTRGIGGGRGAVVRGIISTTGPWANGNGKRSVENHG